jgi:Pol polyprotein, beta-barrel domain/GAG-pre-integrase domain
MSSHLHWFENYKPLSPPRKVWLGDNRYIEVVGEGQINIQLTINGTRKVKGLFKHVLYVPDLNRSLLSVRKLANDGHITEFEGSHCTIRNGATWRVIGQAKLDDGLYILAVSVPNAEKAKVSTTSADESGNDSVTDAALTARISKATLNQWHHRLGHINVDYIWHMVQNGLVNGMSLVPDAKDKAEAPCSACL